MVRIYRPFSDPAYISGMVERIQTFLRDESGATSIEYGLIASGIALAIITAVNRLGTNVKGVFASISTAVK